MWIHPRNTDSRRRVGRNYNIQPTSLGLQILSTVTGCFEATTKLRKHFWGLRGSKINLAMPSYCLLSRFYRATVGGQTNTSSLKSTAKTVHTYRTSFQMPRHFGLPRLSICPMLLKLVRPSWAFPQSHTNSNKRPCSFRRGLPPFYATTNYAPTSRSSPPLSPSRRRRNL